MLVYLALLSTSHILITTTWWEGYLNGWPPTVQLSSIGEQWIEGIIWHIMVMGMPFAFYWMFRRLRPVE